MIVSYNKEKAYNAITFFLEHTSMCNKKKLFKLLWLLDSEHYQETGRSVTGYVYEAWQMGPVPVELDRAMKKHDPELLEHFDLKRQAGSEKKNWIWLESKHPFEAKYFSKKQLQLLQNLVDRFDLATGTEMEAWTHRAGTPWHQVWMVENKNKAVIPYEYTLKTLPQEKQDAILAIARERESFLRQF
jgi:hypothetical protein